MNMYSLIEKKRDGEALTEEEIHFVVSGYTNGDIPDYQVSALLMAIYFQGMTEKELSNLTMAMVHSGDTIDLSKIEGIKVDKHSTGGVGDTTTLILAPLVASAGVPLAKMSGRGLGHTGGTIDKLESVPGFHVELSTEEFVELVNKNKVAVIGQSGNITPADKKLYSLRDVTATVNAIPLIASSIMSKKIAAGSDAIVLDVKTGAGAFMKELDDARALAKSMVKIGNQLNRNTKAVISDMSQPLGFAIGNALEVKEAIDTLKGAGPKDLTELCLVLGSQMLVAAKRTDTLDEARQILSDNLKNGKAISVFETFLKSQGGDSSVVHNSDLLPKAALQVDLPSKSSGYVSKITANELGTAAMMLGAGRQTKESEIDLAVGLVLNKKVGDFVEKGETLLTIHSNSEDLDAIKENIYQSIKVDENKVEPPKLIYELIDG
ncbi:pyrimidine-nucleoside phosphorylase [Oceanobacillus luteolus]|uniref:Pyrimidine-nucleoside phosphorylase n=1 Tax=Oceanobacillus luteolus TaxID=1274358 RepID=A0ABW4HZ30_9BACI|nr:pyrimidine-nucleoside phosphorylase [Oceanobacillus luteolus]MCM3738808.1 pyrimidine-nucleoside phosphorylase [Oceanobacillus luteolus]